MSGGSQQNGSSRENHWLLETVEKKMAEYFMIASEWKISDNSNLNSNEIVAKINILRIVRSTSQSLVDLLKQPLSKDTIRYPLKGLISSMNSDISAYHSLATMNSDLKDRHELQLLLFLQSILGCTHVGYNPNPELDLEQWNPPSYAIPQESFKSILQMLGYAIHFHQLTGSDVTRAVWPFIAYTFTFYGKKDFLESEYQTLGFGPFPNIKFSSGMQYVKQLMLGRTVFELRMDIATLCLDLAKSAEDSLAQITAAANLSAKKLLASKLGDDLNANPDLMLANATIPFDQLELLFRGSREQFLGVTLQDHYEIRNFKGMISRKESLYCDKVKGKPSGVSPSPAKMTPTAAAVAAESPKKSGTATKGGSSSESSSQDFSSTETNKTPDSIGRDKIDGRFEPTDPYSDLFNEQQEYVEYPSKRPQVSNTEEIFEVESETCGSDGEAAETQVPVKRTLHSAALSFTPKLPISKKSRRFFSEDEEKWLMEGAKIYRNQWREILARYPFNNRTSVDLKDKYRNIIKRGTAP